MDFHRQIFWLKYKLAGSRGDEEFWSEVEVLSCTQHRNVVMLIGFCVEDGRKLLVYEYVCNVSLYSHLHAKYLLKTKSKCIGIGAGGGLRYLHEECRVGCIGYRDVRPSNILLTHDFEALNHAFRGSSHAAMFLIVHPTRSTFKATNVSGAPDVRRLHFDVIANHIYIPLNDNANKLTVVVSRYPRGF
ncbi:Proline-rich receptor-like protein kinase PERK8, partial [Mucuna pruriens]